MLRVHPLLGHGVNSYHRIQPLFITGDVPHGYAHNCYLQMWSEVGLLGLVFFLIPKFKFLEGSVVQARRSRAHLDLELALSVSLVALLIQAFFDTTFYALQTSALFWVFWGIYHAQRVR